MELNKRKYKKKEVESLLTVFKIAYEAKLAEQKTAVLELNEKVARLNAELSQYKDKEEVIINTMESAEIAAIGVKEKANLQYSLELERLKQFSARWEKYLNYLQEKYPMYDPVARAVEIKEAIDGLDFNKDSKEAVEEIDDKLVDAELNRPFNPKAKIKDYIAATGDNGFNLEEVLNPGELKLEDLCRELGLIDGNE
jgi:uncharacterized coiled-coil protein SlyX